MFSYDIQRSGMADKISLENLPDLLTVKEVAKHLRNTPSVCRNYYIHPTVIHTYSNNILIPHFKKSHKEKFKGISENEFKVFTLLQKYPYKES